MQVSFTYLAMKEKEEGETTVKSLQLAPAPAISLQSSKDLSKTPK
jgi:hypothetical protein